MSGPVAFEKREHHALRKGIFVDGICAQGGCDVVIRVV